jgi:hypothetical protein
MPVVALFPGLSELAVMIFQQFKRYHPLRPPVTAAVYLSLLI